MASTRTRRPSRVGEPLGAAVTVTEPKAELFDVTLVDPSTATAQLSSTACCEAPVYQSALAPRAGRSAAVACVTDAAAQAHERARAVVNGVKGRRAVGSAVPPIFAGSVQVRFTL